jgi:hypothetical protein
MTEGGVTSLKVSRALEKSGSVGTVLPLVYVAVSLPAGITRH